LQPLDGMDTTDRQESLARVTSYLSRRHGITESEARAQAEEVLILVAGDPVSLREAAARSWWVYLLRGILALVIGVLFLIRPGASLVALVLLFGAWAFIDGVFALTASVTQHRSWRLALIGVVGVAVGVMTFFRPGITALALYAAIAVWTIAKGILEIGLSIELRQTLQAHGRGWMIFNGIVSIIFGVLLIVLPQAGVLTIAWLIGIYGLIFSAFLFALAVRLRRAIRATEPPRHRVVPQPA